MSGSIVTPSNCPATWFIAIEARQGCALVWIPLFAAALSGLNRRSLSTCSRSESLNLTAAGRQSSAQALSGQAAPNVRRWLHSLPCTFSFGSQERGPTFGHHALDLLLTAKHERGPMALHPEHHREFRPAVVFDLGGAIPLVTQGMADRGCQAPIVPARVTIFTLGLLVLWLPCPQ